MNLYDCTIDRLEGGRGVHLYNLTFSEIYIAIGTIRDNSHGCMHVPKEHGVRFVDVSVDPHDVLLKVSPGGVLSLGTE